MNIFLPVVHIAFVFGAQKNRLIEMVLLSTHNIIMFWLRNKKTNFNSSLCTNKNMYMLNMVI